MRPFSVISSGDSNYAKWGFDSRRDNRTIPTFVSRVLTPLLPAHEIPGLSLSNNIYNPTGGVKKEISKFSSRITMKGKGEGGVQGYYGSI